MRYWMWPRRLRLKKRPPKVQRMVRKRRPHRTARDRLRNFGLSRLRYLWFIPVLIALIAVVASVRVPKTTTTWVQQPSVKSESQEADTPIQFGKYRTSIPAGYSLGVDIAWKKAPQEAEFQVELILRDDGGEAVARQTTSVVAGALAASSPVARAELDIPYDLSGKYHLSVQVVGDDSRLVSAEAPLGLLTVY
jgi:hypothetical protein